MLPKKNTSTFVKRNSEIWIFLVQKNAFMNPNQLLPLNGMFKWDKTFSPEYNRTKFGTEQILA